MTSPPHPKRDPMIWPALNALRTSIAAHLALVARPVVTFPLYWGADRPPADACDCVGEDGAQGMGWGRWVMSAPPQDSQRNANAVEMNCGGGTWNTVLEFGVYRCYPTVDENGQFPLEAAIDTATAGLQDDAAALRRGIRCSAWLTDKNIAWAFVTEVPLTPAGGCAGAAIQVRLQRVECKC